MAHGGAARPDKWLAFEKITTGLGWLEKAFTLIAGVAIFFMFAIVLYAVAARYFFGWNTTWALDTTELMMLSLAFLPLAFISRAKGHVSIEFISSYLSKSLDNKLNIVTDLISLAFISLITWRGTILCWEYYQNDSLSAAAKVPIYPFMLVMPLGGLLFFFELIIELVQHLRGAKGITESKDVTGGLSEL